jgi:hypothetical protein
MTHRPETGNKNGITCLSAGWQVGPMEEWFCLGRI